MFVHAYQGYIFNLALSEYMRRGERPEELPMAGHEISLDQITEGILKEEGMSKENFRSKSMPEMSMPGEMREAFVEFKDFGISDFNPVGGNITVRFSLPPGAYATVLLRELMK
jgi:tRNA(Glu) U13 pseudouridine synthase TruD